MKYTTGVSMNDYMKNFQRKPYPILDIKEWKERQEIMAQEDNAVFAMLNYLIAGIYDWKFHE
jgi:hypothetical protein